MIKLGLCCGGGFCCALLSGGLWFGGGTAIQGQSDESIAEVAEKGSASTGAPCGVIPVNVEDVELTADEKRIVDYIADKTENGEAPMIQGDELESKVGLSAEAVEQLDESKLRAGVIAELSRRKYDLSSLGGNCSKFNACSVDRNLMNATGEELERYKEEVALDGRSFSGRVAPGFTLPTTKGGQVSLAEYRGRKVAVIFLSAHCYHSLDTLPILAALKQQYDEEELTILPVFINSGDVDDVASAVYDLDLDYPLLVSEGKEVSNSYDSRMVPSTFLIDEQGNLTRKLVGFKDKATLAGAFSKLIGS